MQNKNDGTTKQLPIRSNLTFAFILSLVIAILIVVVSIIGIVYKKSIYPSDEILIAFLSTDFVNLIIGLPLLLISMLLTRYKKLIGLLSWPGALFYIVYVYIPYMISVPFNALFLPYLLLVTLSLYTMIGIIVSIDSNAVKEQLIKIVPVKPVVGIIGGLGILIILRQVGIIITSLISNKNVDMQEIALWIDDFVVAAPALLIISFLLWKQKSLGYVVAAGILLAYGALSIGLIPLLIFEARFTGYSIDLASIIVLLVMAAICFVPFSFFARVAKFSEEIQ